MGEMRLKIEEVRWEIMGNGRRIIDQAQWIGAGYLGAAQNIESPGNKLIPGAFNSEAA